MTRRIGYLAVFLWVVAVTIQPAHAYLDPANGSMVLQAVLGGLAGFSALLKVLWDALRTRLHRSTAD